MSHQEIRKKFLEFFNSREHKIVSSSSLLPNDPSVLFTTAGMQQFKPYYTGQADPMKDFGLLNTASIQKCMRTSDIDEVGDESHLTFFEMLGNFSFGGYGKEEAIKLAHEFITKELGLKIDYVSVFGGADANKIFQFKKIKADTLPLDGDSKNTWGKLGIEIEIKNGVDGLRDNFWGPTGNEGPCGPTTEIYINNIEIWNMVFNEYYCTKDFKFEPLSIKGVDTGMGLERLAMVAQGKKNIFETDLLEPLIELTPKDMDLKVRRVLVDHSRSIVLLISDGVMPSNKDQGYVLRRLIRRIMAYSYLYLTSQKKEIDFNYENLLEKMCNIYKNVYSNIDFAKVQNELRNEYVKFSRALGSGTIELKKFYNRFIGGVDPQNTKMKIENNLVSGNGLGLELFRIFESYGLHPDISKDILQQWGLVLDQSIIKEYETAINEAKEKHQEISRAGVEKKFGGHGIVEGDLTATNQEEMKKKTRLHTATHIIVAALQKVLGEPLKQAGADITVERLRFDFAFPRKVTPEELKQAEDIANDIIDQNLPVTFKEMPLQEAFDAGAAGVFKAKYPERVRVYTIGSDKEWFSREICGGPHVSHTGEVGHIKITKEESVSGGNRRIRAVIK